MRLVVVLFAMSTLGGCLAPLPGDAATADATAAAAVSPDEACRPGPETVFEWAAPEDNPMGSELGEDSFEVPPGTRRMTFEWTDAPASIGRRSLTVTDPSGLVVWERTHGTGVGVAGGSVTIEGHDSRDSWRNPPPPGEYVFTYHVEGHMQGARLAVVLEGCS